MSNRTKFLSAPNALSDVWISNVIGLTNAIRSVPLSIKARL